MAEQDRNTKAPEPDELLTEAIARNLPLELHRVTGDASIPAARARMLGMDDEHIYLETAQTIGRAVRIHAGDSVDAYFNYSDTIFRFRAEIISCSCTVRLNNDKVIEGWAIRRPKDVVPGQRRDSFRTRLIHEDPISVFMHLTSSEQPDCTPIDVRRFIGTLVDASAGGLGIRIDGQSASQFKMYDYLFVRFALPDHPEEVELLTEIRQSRSVLDETAARIGIMAIPFPTEREMVRQLQPLNRHLTEVQRRLRSAA